MTDKEQACNHIHKHHHHNEHCDCSHDHHHHDEHCDCSHEHHHHDEHCDCSHEHHHHDEHCGCSHEHHHHDEHCGCSHEHHHTEKSSDSKMPETTFPKKIYTIQNLDCPNCAAKMERKIQQLPEVEYVNIVYATNQLRIAASDPDSLIPLIQEICSSIEPNVKITKRIKRKLSESEHSDSGIGQKKELCFLIVGALLFASGELLELFHLPLLSFFVLAAAYLLLGFEVLATAGKNLIKGHLFDENFLMSIATLGAFAIQEYPEAVGVMLFYRIGEYFEHRAVEKSRSQIMNALDLRPETVNRINNQTILSIPAEEAEIGDILLVKPGDRIPLDGIITDGESRIDTSPITGEPVPVSVKPGSSVISGCLNVSGVIHLRVEKTLDESMVSRILDSVENAAANKPQIDRFITRFSRIYTPFVVFLALATAIVPSLLTGNWNYWVYTALTFLVISCPCALVLSVPLAFFSGIGAGSKKGILFKGGVSLEALKQIRTIILDKTGTITKGNFVLQKITAVEPVTEQDVLLYAASCEQSSNHPIAASILTAASEQNLDLMKPVFMEEIAGHGIHAVFADKEILCGNQELLHRFGISMENCHPHHSYGTEVFLAENGKYIGSILIADTIKEQAVDAIRSLKQQGLFSVMLTGDSQESARSVADTVGIDEVHAKLLPQDKLTVLQAIRQSHGKVMFVGDGINDAPVLAGADVGAAMGSGADAAIEAADVVFMTSDMAAIPQALSIARITSRISWQNVIFALAIKILVMILGLLGFANMWMAVFADTGVAILCILNSIRILYHKI